MKKKKMDRGKICNHNIISKHKRNNKNEWETKDRGQKIANTKLEQKVKELKLLKFKKRKFRIEEQGWDHMVLSGIAFYFHFQIISSLHIFKKSS